VSGDSANCNRVVGEDVRRPTPSIGINPLGPVTRVGAGALRRIGDGVVGLVSGGLVNLVPPLFSVLPRSRASVVLLAAAVVMATVATTLVAAVPLYADAIVEAGLRSTLADAPPAESGLEASFRAEAAAWDRNVDRLAAIGDARLPGRLDTLTIARSDTFTLPDDLASAPDGSGRITSLAVLAGGDDLVAPVGTTAGTTAGTAGGSSGDVVPATLHVDAAAALGLGVGDEIDLVRGDAPVTVRITGLFEAADRADERWFDQPLLRDGFTTSGSFTEVGPFVVEADDFTALAGTANYRWRVIVDPDSVTTADLDRLRAGAAGMDTAIGDSVDANNLEVTTQLPAFASVTDTAIGSTSAVIAAILLQLVGVALYGVGLAASVLVSSRAVETSMLRSRGATPRQLGAMAAAEAVLIAAPAAALGPYLGGRVVELVERWGPVASTGLDLQPTLSRTAVLASAAVGVVVVAIVTWPAVRSARGFARAQAARARQEGPMLLQRSGLDVALVALALLGLWRLSDSSAATSDLAGRLGTDPVLVLAPTLGVLAASLVTLRLVALSAAGAQRYTASQGAVPTALAGWELARRPGRTARTSVLVVLSVTVGTFAAVHGASWERSQRDQADAAVSADAIVAPDSRPSAAVPDRYLPSAYRSLDGVEALVPVDRLDATLSADGAAIPVVATDTEHLADVLRVRDDLLGGAELDALDRPGDLAAVVLTDTPGDVAGDLAIDYRLEAVVPPDSGASRPIDVTAVVLDGNGSLVRIESDGVPTDAPNGTITFPLTTASVPGYDLGLTGPLRLVELEIGAPSVEGSVTFGEEPEPIAHATFDLTLAAGRVGDREVSLAAGWLEESLALPNVVELPTAALAAPAESDGGFRVVLDTGVTEQVRADLVVRYGTTLAGVGAGFTVPVMVTPGVLADTGLDVGATASTRLAGTATDVVIVGVVPVVPFAPDVDRAVLVDWETFNVDRWSRSRRIEPVDEWAVAVDDASVDALRATVSGEPFASEGFSDRRQLARDIARAPVTVGLSGSLGLAIAASLVVAGIGLVLTAVVGARERRPAFAVLRALGTRASELRRWLLLETVPLVGVSAAAGVASGIALARLGLPSLAVGTDGERAIPTPSLVVPWSTLGLIVLIAGAAGMALPIATSRLLRRHRTADELRIGDTS
jgi:hypothetical protein